MSSERIHGLSACTVDFRQRTVCREDQLLSLTAREARLLEYLIDRPGRVVSREELYEHVWEYADSVVSRALDFTVCRVRAKVERDPSRPVHLFTERGVGYRFEPALSLSLPNAPPPETSGPPDDPTRFLGREREMEELADRLSVGRVVTLLGPPGMGKTRLAAEFARKTTASGSFPGGIMWVDLSECGDAGDVVAETSRVLAVSRASADALPLALAARGRALLVHDNFETVVSTAAAMVAQWSRRAPELRILVTSRERLRISGEWTLELTPLDADSAVELFAERSRALGRTVSTENLPVVRQLTERLDRVPLAIELCAGRANVLSPRAMLDRWSPLDTRASDSSRDVATRHTTLRAAIDWSWRQLAAGEQAVLAQCAVFRGGFSLPAAEAVLVPPEHSTSVLDLLAGLCDRSLLRTWEVTASGEVRFGTYSAIREFAAEHLAVDDEAYGRHRDYYASLGTRLDTAVGTRGGRAELDELLLERENLQAVVSQRVDDRAAVLASIAYFNLASLRGGDDGVCPLLEAGVERSVNLEPQLRSRAHASRALCDILRGRVPHADLALALELADEARDSAWRGVVLCLSASSLEQHGDLTQAEARYKEALLLHERSNACRFEAMTLRQLAVIARTQGRFLESEAWLRDALTLAKSIPDDDLTLASVRVSLGNLLLSQGRNEEARQVFVEALRRIQACGRRVDEASIHDSLASLSLVEGQVDQAREHAKNALRTYLAVGLPVGIAISRLRVGVVEAFSGDLDAAVRCFDEADRTPGAPPQPQVSAYRALIRWRQGRREAAVAALVEAQAAAGERWSSFVDAIEKLVGGESVDLVPLERGPVRLRIAARLIRSFLADGSVS